MKKFLMLLVLLAVIGCASAPMPQADYYAAIIEIKGVILGVIELDGRLFFIGAVPQGGWEPQVEETQS